MQNGMEPPNRNNDPYIINRIKRKTNKANTTETIKTSTVLYIVMLARDTMRECVSVKSALRYWNVMLRLDHLYAVS